ncbi:MAG: hypothetical protein IKC98_06535 [Firmicutes bacterium]|nr:hypothetical protein [Bacillota bacterium]
MKIQILGKESVYEAKVIHSKGGYVMIACNGKVRKEYNPALAKQYSREHRNDKRQQKSKKKANNLNLLPTHMFARANDVQVHKVNIPVPPLHATENEKGCNVTSCRVCMNNISGECIGAGAVCEFFKYAPEEEVTAKSRRLMMQ